MTIYNFRCHRCGETSHTTQRDYLVPCSVPLCGGTTYRVDERGKAIEDSEPRIEWVAKPRHDAQQRAAFALAIMVAEIRGQYEVLATSRATEPVSMGAIVAGSVKAADALIAELAK